SQLGSSSFTCFQDDPKQSFISGLYVSGRG
ncbi:hypothetical protein A2U01_0085777, partial [Trifolium medium]|nr:hypothetical protein [Trifolium medium]